MMIVNGPRGGFPCPSAVPWRSRTTSAPPCSLIATTIPSPLSASAVLPSSKSLPARLPLPWLTSGCSNHATRTPCLLGSTMTRRKDSLVCSPTTTAATGGGAFHRDHQRKQPLEERLHQGPGQEARQQAAATPPGTPPRRWRWDTIRVRCDWLADSTLSGVWRLLDRLGLRLRSARVQQFRPDPLHPTFLKTQRDTSIHDEGGEETRLLLEFLQRLPDGIA